MRPTARAEALREPLRQALDALERAVSPASPFDPSKASHTWRVAAADYGESTVLLPALAGLRSAAPGARLAVLQLAPSRIVRQAEQGEIDLAFHTSEESPSALHRRTLFTERYVLAGRAGHPRLKRRPTLAQFAALDHVIVSPEGGGFRGITDEALAGAGLARRVVLSVPHFLFVVSVLEHRPRGDAAFSPGSRLCCAAGCRGARRCSRVRDGHALARALASRPRAPMAARAHRRFGVSRRARSASRLDGALTAGVAG
jgi:DNA-binding transcriptional LysR family regulator